MCIAAAVFLAHPDVLTGLFLWGLCMRRTIRTGSLVERLNLSYVGPKQKKCVSIHLSIYRSAVMTVSVYISTSESAASSADVCDAWSSCPTPF